MNLKIAIAVVTGTVASTLAIRECVHICRDESKKRASIASNAALDILAIRTAADVMTARIDNGEIRSLSQLADTLHNEIAFQKIAIREED